MRRWSPRHHPYRWWGGSLAALLLCLVGCSPWPTATHPNTPSAGQSVVLPGGPSPTPTSNHAGPSPVAGVLAPVPTACPSSPSLQTRGFPQFSGFSGPVTFSGQAPVWVATPYLPTTPVHLDDQGYTAWPGTKIVWEVGPSFAQPVRVTITNMATGQLAWWGEGGDPAQSGGTPAQTLVLDPANADPSAPAVSHGSPEAGWNEWGSFVYLPDAACYTLTASWAGGQWGWVFAAGR